MTAELSNAKPTGDITALKLGLLAVLFWSTIATAFKLGLTVGTPLQLIAGATLLSTLIFWGYRWWLGDTAEAPAAFRQSALLGLLNPLLYYPVLLAGYDRLPAQLAQPLNYTWALWLALLAWPLLGQRPASLTLVGMLLALLGVAVLVQDDGQLGAVDPLGVLLLLGSAVLWAGYWLLLTRLQQRTELSAQSALTASFTVAAPLLVLAAALTDGAPRWTPEYLLACAWIGTLEMGLTFLLWQAALARATEAGRVAQLIFLSPLLALVPIHFVLGEPLRPHALLGLLLILAGMACAQRSPRRDTRSRAPT